MTAENVVYIPTLGRLEHIKKIVPYWLQQEIDIRIVVERYEYNEHAKLKREMGWGKEVVILTQPLSGRGIAYVRAFIVKHAKNAGHTAIIIAEDDTRPMPSSDMVLLLEEADKPYVVGVGATRPIHDFFTQGAITRVNRAGAGAILCPGSWGVQCFAINVDTVLRLGNYNTKLDVITDDVEMMMRGIEAGMPWRIHTDVKMGILNRRYAPGGINTFFGNDAEKRHAAEMKCWDLLRKRYPGFVSYAERPRISFQKLYDTYIPEWREYSAIHGGSLDAYDNSPIEEDDA